jgi:uncharacterized OsmC-like protein
MKPAVIRETIESWTEEPGRALALLSVTARSAGAQAVVESGIFSWWSDLPRTLGGSAQAPSPSTLLLSALASSAVVLVRDTLAPQLGVAVESVEATARCDSDYRGLLSLDGVDPALGGVDLRIQVVSSDGEEAVAKLYRVWEERSPVFLALRKGLAIRTTLTVTAPA